MELKDHLTLGLSRFSDVISRKLLYIDPKSPPIS